jgi:hypothetical protein
MARSTDLLDALGNSVYYINLSEMSIEKEVLIPVCNNDWTWYSYRNDIYLIESEIFDTEREAAELLLGEIIKRKKESILYYSRKENELIELINGNKLERVV